MSRSILRQIKTYKQLVVVRRLDHMRSPGRLLGKIDRYPSFLKSNRLHVHDIVQLLWAVPF